MAPATAMPTTAATMAATAVSAAAPTAKVRRPTTYRSAMTISLHIAPSVIAAAKKIDIRSAVVTVIAVVSITTAVTAIHVTRASRQGSHQDDAEPNLDSVYQTLRVIHKALPIVEEIN